MSKSLSRPTFCFVGSIFSSHVIVQNMTHWAIVQGNNYIFVKKKSQWECHSLPSVPVYNFLNQGLVTLYSPLPPSLVFNHKSYIYNKALLALRQNFGEKYVNYNDLRKDQCQETNEGFSCLSKKITASKASRWHLWSLVALVKKFCVWKNSLH